MSLRFYTDTHIAKQVAIQLRERGIDVVRCEEVGMADADDDEHLEYAVQHGLTVITKDNDFLRLHAQWMAAGQEHAGIFFSSKRAIPAIGEIVVVCSMYYELIKEGAGTAEDDVHNQTIFIKSEGNP